MDSEAKHGDKGRYEHHSEVVTLIVAASGRYDHAIAVRPVDRGCPFLVRRPKYIDRLEFLVEGYLRRPTRTSAWMISPARAKEASDALRGGRPDPGHRRRDVVLALTLLEEVAYARPGINS